MESTIGTNMTHLILVMMSVVRSGFGVLHADETL